MVLLYITVAGKLRRLSIWYEIKVQTDHAYLNCVGLVWTFEFVTGFIALTKVAITQRVALCKHDPMTACDSWIILAFSYYLKVKIFSQSISIPDVLFHCASICWHVQYEQFWGNLVTISKYETINRKEGNLRIVVDGILIEIAHMFSSSRRRRKGEGEAKF